MNTFKITIVYCNNGGKSIKRVLVVFAPHCLEALQAVMDYFKPDTVYNVNIVKLYCCGTDDRIAIFQ